MHEHQGPSISPEVLTSSVWDAISGIPGVVDLHRSALQSIGERMGRERYGPVRLGHDGDDAVLEVHVVVDGLTDLTATAEAVARACVTRLAGAADTEVARVEVHIDALAGDE